MYERAMDAGMGQELQVQHEMIFEHARLKDWVRV
jgi:alanine dehydrogenase